MRRPEGARFRREFEKGGPAGPPFFVQRPVWLSGARDGADRGDSRRGQGRFNAYVAPARNGKEALWRLALGLVLVAAVWLVGTLGIVVVGVGGVVLREGLDGNSLDAIADRIDGEWLFRSPSGTCLVLGSFVAMWAGVWLALRVLHGRSIGSALGAERRLNRADFGRAAVAAFALGVVHIPVVG